MGRPRKVVEQTVAAPKTETKRECFQRIAPARVRRVLHAIHLVGNCSGPNYESTKSEQDFIRQTLLNAVNAAMDRYSGVDDKVEFSLPHAA